MSNTRVVALERGHCGRAVREQGEEFEVDLADPKFKNSTWFTPVDKAPKPKKVDPNARPPGAGPSKGSAPPDISPGDVA
jgi:hypothetical protein